MQLIKKTKKGFTLVELIVVIAIVAILAAVSVVSYIAFINSANESADIQLVKQVNIALLADKNLNGERESMYDMLLAIEEHGFVVENLTKTASGNDIVFDNNNYTFGLVKDGKTIYSEPYFDLNTDKYNVWTFVNNMEEFNQAKEDGYAIYLTEDFGKYEGDLAVTTGFDAGVNIISGTVLYDNSAVDAQPRNVIIRTGSSGTNISIDAYKDHVLFPTSGKFGKALKLITANNSFEENGQCAWINLDEGRIVINEQSAINKIFLNVDKDNVEQKLSITLNKGATLTQDMIQRPVLDLGENEVIKILEVTDSETEVTETYFLQGDATIEGGDVLVSLDGTEESAEPVTTSNASETARAIANVLDEHGDVQETGLTESEQEEKADDSVKEMQNDEVADMSDTYVCRIGLTGYPSFTAALVVAINREESNIIMLQDSTFTLFTRFDITNTKIFVDLNGYILTHTETSRPTSYLLRPSTNCEFKVFDSQKSGRAAFNHAQSANVLSLQNNALVTLKDITLNSGTTLVSLSSSSTLIIDNCVLSHTSNYTAGISTNGTSNLEIYNSTIIGGPAVQISSTGNVKIDNCDLIGYYTSIVTFQKSGEIAQITNSRLSVRAGAKLQTGLYIQSNANTILLDNVSIDMANSTHEEQYAIRMTSEGVSDLTLNSCSIINVTGYCICMDMDGYGDATLNACELRSTEETVEMDEANGHVTFNSGCLIYTEQDSIYYTVNGSMTTVNPGVTMNVNPGTSNYKYTVNGVGHDNGDGTWTVIPNA